MIVPLSSPGFPGHTRDCVCPFMFTPSNQLVPHNYHKPKRDWSYKSNLILINQQEHHVFMVNICQHHRFFGCFTSPPRQSPAPAGSAYFAPRSVASESPALAVPRAPQAILVSPVGPAVLSSYTAQPANSHNSGRNIQIVSRIYRITHLKCGKLGRKWDGMQWNGENIGYDRIQLSNDI